MQEGAKRAIEVAKAGKLSVLLIGGDEAQKLKDENPEVNITVVTPCPCGYLGDRAKECYCTPSQIKLHSAKFPKTDITVEVPRSTFDEWWAETSSVLALYKGELSSISQTEREHGKEFLRKAYNLYGFDAIKADTVSRIAKTIYELNDGSDWLPAIAEAIQYQLK